MNPTSFIVKVLQTNAIIFTKCADLQLKIRINYILIMAQVLYWQFCKYFYMYQGLSVYIEKNFKAVN